MHLGMRDLEDLLSVPRFPGRRAADALRLLLPRGVASRHGQKLLAWHALHGFRLEERVDGAPRSLDLDPILDGSWFDPSHLAAWGGAHLRHPDRVVAELLRMAAPGRAVGLLGVTDPAAIRILVRHWPSGGPSLRAAGPAIHALLKD